jgi:hypothetical protein
MMTFCEGTMRAVELLQKLRATWSELDGAATGQPANRVTREDLIAALVSPRTSEPGKTVAQVLLAAPDFFDVLDATESSSPRSVAPSDLDRFDSGVDPYWDERIGSIKVIPTPPAKESEQRMELNPQVLFRLAAVEIETGEYATLRGYDKRRNVTTLVASAEPDLRIQIRPPGWGTAAAVVYLHGHADSGKVYVRHIGQVYTVPVSGSGAEVARQVAAHLTSLGLRVQASNGTGDYGELHF